MLFRKMKEMQSLINSRTSALKLAESQIDNRNKFIAYQKEQIEQLKEENKELRFEDEDKDYLISRIERLLSANKYNNEKVVLDKIKELVREHQSLN